MKFNYHILLGVFSIVFFVVLIELIRRRHLREKYSILWLVIFLALPSILAGEKLISSVSIYLGIMYPPTLVFMAAFSGLLLITLMLSVIDSHQTDRIIKLTQRVALQDKRISALEHSLLEETTKRSRKDG